jgi:hypothetical protein
MKMDATLKRRMFWGVAIAHLLMTAFFAWAIAYHQILSGGMFEPNEYARFVAWGNFVLKAFYLLQPQLWVVFKMGMNHWSDFDLKLIAASIPFWSFCLGLLFTKAVSRFMRHTPLATHNC